MVFAGQTRKRVDFLIEQVSAAFDVLVFPVVATLMTRVLVQSRNRRNYVELFSRQGKGDDRPINRLEDRMALLAALESVSLVTWFDADTPLDLILAARPDVLVKGGDWPIENIVGAAEVTGWGGSVYSIPFQHHTSTTDLLGRIRA